MPSFRHPIAARKRAPDMSGGALARLRTLLETRVDRDGQAAALEPPADVADGVAPAREPDGGATRRERALGVPRDLIDGALSQKVLHGWLQNRHQVLVPLTFRLGRLAGEDRATLLRFAALCLLDAGNGTPAQGEAAERWLREGGADEAGLALFRAALHEPPALHGVMRAIRTQGLGAYAYAAAVGVADTREPAARCFAAFVAARLDIPADAVRSIDRRYRR